MMGGIVGVGQASLPGCSSFLHRADPALKRRDIVRRAYGASVFERECIRVR
jgi:hypothetical protein